MPDPALLSDIPKNVPFAFAINNRNIMPDPALLEDAASPSPPCAHLYTDLTCPLRCKGDPTNGRHPPAASGTDSPHPCRCPFSRRAPTPHLRTPDAGTARAHTSSRVLCRSPETGFSAYGSRARGTPAIRQLLVHMVWDLEAYQLTPWRQDVWSWSSVVNDFSYLAIFVSDWASSWITVRKKILAGFLFWGGEGKVRPENR